MKTSSSRSEQLFADALAQPREERGSYLAAACGADVDLLAHLVALVAAHEGPESLMASSAASPLLRASAAPDEKPADVIGRYKLLQQLGEGGCGVVWMAEQEEPVRRRVALKTPPRVAWVYAIPHPNGSLRSRSSPLATFACAYSFGMPHSPAAISRRFISGVTGTAPSDFRRRRKAGSVAGSSLAAAGGTRTIVCLTRVVFVVRFEMVDGMGECLIEIQIRQPTFFTQAQPDDVRFVSHLQNENLECVSLPADSPAP
ncbi:MAG: hypothetical protein Q7S40_00450 [Opitutaceae bacterium]|nr:hypothetical protein [Opitutaceae bacterium]